MNVTESEVLAMETVILSGKAVSRDMKGEMKIEVASLQAEHGLTPGLAVVLVGEDSASSSYVKGKRRASRKVGIKSDVYHFEPDITEAELLSVIGKLNENSEIHGILVQLPLPSHLCESVILNAVKPEKDVDGLHPVNLGRLIRGEDGFIPCTPYGVQQLLVRSGLEIQGRHIVIVGRSILVGKPLAALLLRKIPGGNATVTICHTGTRDLTRYTRQADILVVAAGRPHTVTADMVSEGTVVVDVGVNRVDDESSKKGYRLIGDVDFDSVSLKASAITPVPGGVGPMTITMLLYNTILAAKRARGLA